VVQILEYQENFGGFPRKGAAFHYHFAKLYLYYHAVRGFGSMPIPPQLSEAAHGGISAATSIIEMIITDDDVSSALIGLPCYVQSMIGFACVFLARFHHVHGEGFVKRDNVIGLVSSLRTVYASKRVSKWHLTNLIPGGLDRILATLRDAQGGQLASTNGNPTPMHGTRGPGTELEQRMDVSASGLDTFSMGHTGLDFASTQNIYLGNGYFDLSSHDLDYNFN
jgi:hypothetical protein